MKRKYEGEVITNKNVGDLRQFHKTMQKVDEKRLARLRDAKNNNDIKKMVHLSSKRELTGRVLTDKMRLAIHYLTDFNNERNLTWVATKINVTLQTLLSWRNDPMFIKAMDTEITKRRNFMRLHAFRNVNRAIARGSMKDTWKYLQLSGDLKEHHQHSVDPTGETEMTDEELAAEIKQMQRELKKPKLKIVGNINHDRHAVNE